ncbi:adenosylmethionine--8-amino-7-oxononanoate transaminase [Aliikangiella sp. IMCC44632]
MDFLAQDLSFDRQHLWHPYTNLKQPTPVFGVTAANGVYLTLDGGQQVIDGMSSWWSTIHGYNHPHLNNALISQVNQFSHVMFGGLTHQPAIQLGKKLIAMTAEELTCLFLADSGSVAVEVALKMALQYYYSQGKTKKTQFLTFKNGYHGDTFGAMSVCDPENGMHSMFAGVLPKHLFVEAPNCISDDLWKDSDIEPFKQAIQRNSATIAAVIIEPLVQGAGGMRVYCAEYLRQIRRLCDENDVLLIVDEIATGFGRTGSLFAYQQAQITPDILCLGKALTGGYMSLAATLTTRKVADVISSYAGGNLMHGPTFMGNPLACAVANASLELLENGDWQTQVSRIELQLQAELAPLAELPSVADVRVKGAIGVVEMKQAIDMHWVTPRLVELGVWIRPFGKLLYIMPAYIITAEQLSKLTKAIKTIAMESLSKAK